MPPQAGRQYLSTDPNAGQPTASGPGRYLSTDPSAGGAVQESQEAGWGDYVALALRGLGGVLGGPGGPWGAAVSGIAEVPAQIIEEIGGRQRFRPWGQRLAEIGVQAGLGAVPAGKLIGTGRSALAALRGAGKGGLLGGGSGAVQEGARQLTDDQEGFDVGAVGSAAKAGALIGAAGGAGGAALAGRFGRGAADPGAPPRTGEPLDPYSVRPTTDYDPVPSPADLPERLAPLGLGRRGINAPLRAPGDADLMTPPRQDRLLPPDGPNQAYTPGDPGFGLPRGVSRDINQPPTSPVSPSFLGAPFFRRSAGAGGGEGDVVPPPAPQRLAGITERSTPAAAPPEPVISAPPAPAAIPEGPREAVPPVPPPQRIPGITERVSAEAPASSPPAPLPRMPWESWDEYTARANAHIRRVSAEAGLREDDLEGRYRLFQGWSLDHTPNLGDEVAHFAREAQGVVPPNIHAEIVSGLTDLGQQGRLSTDDIRVLRSALGDATDVGNQYTNLTRTGDFQGAREVDDSIRNFVDLAKSLLARKSGGAASASGAAPSASVTAMAMPHEPVPPEVVALWQKLAPKWRQALDAQEGDGIPFTVDPSEDLASFARRVMHDDPNTLMGGERKVRQLLDARNTGGDRGESGFIDPEVLARLGLIGGGGAAGAALDPDDPLRGALVGAGVGGGAQLAAKAPAAMSRLLNRIDPSDAAPSTSARIASLRDADRVAREFNLGRQEKPRVEGPAPARRATDALAATGSDSGHLNATEIGQGLQELPQLLSRLRYFSMLGSTGTQATNLIGNAGAISVKALEEALTGNPDRALRILSNVFTPETAKRMIHAFRQGGVDPDTRWGSTAGVLGIPSRLMHSIDEGVSGGLRKAGFSAQEAKDTLFTGQPLSKTGRWLASRPTGFNLLAPFVRTATNIAERGLEYTPGAGLLPAVRAMRNPTGKQLAVRQALGALAASLGAASADPSGEHRGYIDNKFVNAALGPLMLPAQLGAAARRGYSKTRSTQTPARRVATELAGELVDALPLPTGAYEWDPARILASFVPGLLADMSLVDPRELDQSHGLLDPAIAKIPGLNTAMLPRRPKERRRRRR